MGYFITDLDRLPDPLKTNMWKLKLFGYSNTKHDYNSDFEIMVKSTTIPEIETNTETVKFMGFERKLPTTFKYQTETTVEILEPSDLRGYKYLTHWNQSVLNSLLLENNDINLSATNYGSEANINVFGAMLILYNNTGDEVFHISYRNLWPSKISSTNISYEGSGLLKYNVTFTHDKFRFIFPNKQDDYVGLIGYGSSEKSIDADKIEPLY